MMKSLKIRAALLTVVGRVSVSPADSIVMAQTGPPGVWRSAEPNPDSWSDKPVKVSGTVKYDFVLE